MSWWEPWEKLNMAAHTTRRVTLIHNVMGGGVFGHEILQGSDMKYNNKPLVDEDESDVAAVRVESSSLKTTNESNATVSTRKPGAMGLLDLPQEIVALIIHHLCPEWSLSIVDRCPIPSSTLMLSPIPTSALLLANKQLHSLAAKQEESSFEDKLIFTTASTPWRILTRMRTISPTRLTGYLDRVRILKFCYPPLFTTRIPWSQLPALRKIELDYTTRSANFRCHGTRDHLDDGWLDWTIVSFARDTEKFDENAGFDAWRAGSAKLGNEVLMMAGLSVGAAGSADPPSRPGIEVHVYKRMLVVQDHVEEDIDTGARSAGWRGIERARASRDGTFVVKVTAVYRGVLSEVSYEISELTGTAASTENVLIWQRHGKMLRWPAGRDRRVLASASQVLTGNENAASYAGV